MTQNNPTSGRSEEALMLFLMMIPVLCLVALYAPKLAHQFAEDLPPAIVSPSAQAAPPSSIN